MNSRAKATLLSAITFSASILALLYLATASAHIQKGAKKITFFSYDFVPNNVPAPIEITGIKVKGKPVKFNEPFEEPAADWLNGITFEVRNAGDKAISYFDIELVVKFQNSEIDGQIIPVAFGLKPIPGKVSPTAQLPSSDYASASLLSHNFNTIMSSLEKEKTTYDKNSVEVSIGQVIFSDDTRWSGGNLFKRDPTNNRRWIRADQVGFNKALDMSRQNRNFVENQCVTEGADTEAAECEENGDTPCANPEDCETQMPIFFAAVNGVSTKARIQSCSCIHTGTLCKNNQRVQRAATG
jgi:hypothetical protein